MVLTTILCRCGGRIEQHYEPIGYSYGGGTEVIDACYDMTHGISKLENESGGLGEFGFSAEIPNKRE